MLSHEMHNMVVGLWAFVPLLTDLGGLWVSFRTGKLWAQKKEISHGAHFSVCFREDCNEKEIQSF